MKTLQTIVNEIISESFETGPRNATAGAGKDKESGGVQRHILAGELVSSPAYSYQVPSSAGFQKLSNLLFTQAQTGLGDHASALSEAVSAFVEGYLEDSAVDIYTNPNNVEYLIKALHESGYTEYSSAIDAITLNPKIDDVAKINEMLEVLSKDNKNDYFTESLIHIAEQIVEAEEAEEGEEGEEEGSDSTPTAESGTPVE